MSKIFSVSFHVLPNALLVVRALCAGFVLAICAPSASAQTATPTLRVLTTGAFKQVVVALIPDFEAGTGAKVDLLSDTAGGLSKRIEAGETFDVVFLTPAGLNTLSGQGKVDPASVKSVARVAIGVAVREGAPLPPLDTVEQFKQAVLNARKVAYIDPASGGSSGIYLDGLFKRMDIADAVRPKAVLVPGGYAAERVANGEADLVIHQVSEILPVKGVTLAGRLPKEIQSYTTYGYGLSPSTRMRAAAEAFVATFTANSAAEVIRAKGMELAQ